MRIEWFSSSTLSEVSLLALAFFLSACVGLERQRKLKSAGLRTHALVGIGSAAFTLVSAYGFQASLLDHATVVDPSRIAAQIVSGIGFLGAGVIFVRRDAISGLTTAASVWVTASIGMACGAGLPLLAIVTTLLHLLAVWTLGRLGHVIRRRTPENVVVVRYREGNGALRNTLSLASANGFEVLVTEVKELTRPGKSPRFQATLALRSEPPRSPGSFMNDLASLPGVTAVEHPSSDDD